MTFLRIHILILLGSLIMAPFAVNGQIMTDTIPTGSSIEPDTASNLFIIPPLSDTCRCPYKPDTALVSLAEISPIVITEMGREVNLLSFDAEQLARNRTAPLADLLAQVPSIFIKSYGQVGISTPSFRGTGAGHTQVYWNAVPINSPMLGQSDLSLGATGLFEAITVNFGSTSLRLGSGGLGGAIQLNNRSTSSYPGNRWKLSLGQEIGSFGNYRSHLGSEFRKNKFWMSTQFVGALGENDFTFRNLSQVDQPIDTLERSALQQFSLMQQFGWGNDWEGFKVRLWINNMSRELPPTMLTNNLTESQSDRSVRAQAEWGLGIGKWNLNSTLSHSFDWLDYQNLQAGIFSTSSSYLNDVNFLLRRFKFNHQLVDNVEFGARIGYDISQSEGYTSDKTQFRTTFHARFLTPSTRKHQLEILVRESYRNNTLTLPYGVVSYHHRFSNISRFHLNLARNYRFPTLNDLYWSPGGNPDLETETAWSIETGYDKIFMFYSMNRHLALKIDAYTSLINNWIQWVPVQGNIWSPENVQQVLARGAEANLGWINNNNEIKYELRGGYALSISESIKAQGSQTVALDKQLIYTPRHTGTISGQLKYKGLKLYFAQQFVGLRYIARDNSASLPAYHLGEVRGGYTFGKKSSLELYGGVRNLWDAEYQAIAWRPMPGRNYFVGLRFNFKHSMQ